jgi:hypothetical protein
MVASEVPTARCVSTELSKPCRVKLNTSTGTMMSPPPTPNRPAILQRTRQELNRAEIPRASPQVTNVAYTAIRCDNVLCQMDMGIRLVIRVDWPSSTPVSNSGMTSFYNPAFHPLKWSAGASPKKTTLDLALVGLMTWVPMLSIASFRKHCLQIETWI